MISIDEFARVEMRLGLVTESTGVEGSEKLIKLRVDFGDEQRTIFTGIRKWYEPEQLLNRKLVFVTNIAPRKMMGEESQGMVLAFDGPNGKPTFILPEADVPLGSILR